MKKITFDCHGNSAPAYSCSEPGDKTGSYYQSAEVDETFKEAAKIIVELCDHFGIIPPEGTLKKLGAVSTEDG